MKTNLATHSNYLAENERSHSSQPQAWVNEMVGTSVKKISKGSDQLQLCRRVGQDFTLVTARLKAARDLNSVEFCQAVEAVYDGVIHAAETRRLVRVWNFIPGILEPLGEVDQRYKVFNVGRFNSYSRWYGGKGEFRRRVATASGIGAPGDDFIVQALATENSAVSIENPRQVSSYRYSKKYGRLPPCFARATRVAFGPGGERRLLVGGTASICGEATYHNDELEPQLDETIQNLAAVVVSGLGGDDGCCVNRGYRSSLANYRYLRVYCPQSGDLEIAAAKLQQEFENVERMELVQSDLCREGLRVEIEGWAELNVASAP